MKKHRQVNVMARLHTKMVGTWSPLHGNVFALLGGEIVKGTWNKICRTVNNIKIVIDDKIQNPDEDFN